MSRKYLKVPLIILGLMIALAGGYFLVRTFGQVGNGTEPVVKEGAEPSEVEKTRYTCGMHPFIILDEPGTCPICGMNLTPLKPGTGGETQAAKGGEAETDGGGERRVRHWISPMDPTYVREEPGKDYMGHDLVPVYENGGGGSEITIDPVTMQNMGIRTAPVTRQDLHREVRTVGRIGFEESKQYMVNSKIGGWIERLYVNQTGQLVKKGQPLLEIYSPELVAAQQEYLLALGHRDELKKSSFAEIGAGGDRLVEAARQRLRYWDISAKQIKQLEQSGRVRKTMTLYSPFNGIVMEKKVLEGMNVMPGMELMQISDISRVWVYADIYEYELPWVKQGQQAIVEFPHAANKTMKGKVAYVYPTVEPMTRTVQARIELPNPGLELKPEMFVNVRLQTEPITDALTIPIDAVLNSGTGQHVFVALGDGKFEPRTVTTGLQGSDGRVQVLSGLKDGEKVVTAAQFLLDSESKLREAIQKMLAPKQPGPAPDDKHKGHDMPAEDLERLFE
jgi:Cu(I)/Ag(I) efflux system membrane fusion protein/cobalt-zinc-cadmium efflux system membrane fusion protein